MSGTNLFAGTAGNGVFRSTDNGTNWTVVNSGLPEKTYVEAFAVSGTNLFAGTYGGGVFLSTNNGTDWTEVDTSLGDLYVYSLAIYGTNLFAGTWRNGVWYRPLSQMVTDVQRQKKDLPSTFSLGQNYPNPFNPTTIISYQLPTNVYVILRVYDVLGRVVKVLINKQEIAGIHSVQFEASNLPGGVYFYRLQAGNYSATKKLLLLK